MERMTSNSTYYNNNVIYSPLKLNTVGIKEVKEMSKEGKKELPYLCVLSDKKRKDDLEGIQDKKPMVQSRIKQKVDSNSQYSRKLKTKE